MKLSKTLPFVVCGIALASHVQAEAAKAAPIVRYDRTSQPGRINVSVTRAVKMLSVTASYWQENKGQVRPETILLSIKGYAQAAKEKDLPSSLKVRFAKDTKSYPIEVSNNSDPRNLIFYVSVPVADFIRIFGANVIAFDIGKTTSMLKPEDRAAFKELAATIPAANPAKGYRRVPEEGPTEEVTAVLKKLSVPSPPLATPLAAQPKVILETSKGSITLQLDTAAAPLTVRSFVYLVQSGFYNGVTFHRLADLTGDGGNIIQGGDPLSKSAATREYAGMGGPGYQVPLEISKLKHDEMAISMARTSDPDSAGSQFFICQGPVHFLDGQYAVFGKVIAGQQIAKRLTQGDTIITARVSQLVR